MADAERLDFDLDDEDLKLFNEEAEEQIELLDTALVQMEGEPDPELVQRIFRAAHTLKGSAATIGHSRMADLTHAMETVLDAVRQGRRTPDRDVVDALLAGIDALRELADEVVTRISSGVDPAPLVKALLAVVEDPGADPQPASAEAGGSAYELDAGVETTIRAEIERGTAAYLATIDLAADCQLPSIRCFQVIQEPEELSQAHQSWPDQETIERGDGGHRLVVILTSLESDERIAAAITDISDVAESSTRALDPGELASLALPPAAAPAQMPEPAAADRGAPAQSATSGELTTPPARRQASSVRIDVERLNGLMNLVGELVIDRTRLEQIREQLTHVLRDANEPDLTENFEETTSHLARVTDELQEEIMRSRMLPVRSVLSRLPRIVRDVASKGGKRVELTMSGEDTELDRSVIEELTDPLVHILRNAVDHGIEPPAERLAAGKPEAGQIKVTAWNQETYIYLSVSDDGRGIAIDRLLKKAVERGIVSSEAAASATPEAALDYLFMAGLSTAAEVTDVSGRGVGMDIVRTNIERLNGEVRVRSTPGEGSEFTIQLPLTLATTKALMVLANETVYAVPLVSVTEALSTDEAALTTVDSHRVMRLRGKLLQVFELAEALGDGRDAAEAEPRFVVAARHGDREAAFLVDRLLGEQDVVVKSLGKLIGSRSGLSGATILGDGRLGLIIDTASLISSGSVIAPVPVAA